MTLSPESRVLLTDALRPPAGYRVDVAVGTTYSLNLTALLLAPLSFAMYERVAADQLAADQPDGFEAADPVRLLDAMSRYADRTTVFCQAGAIHVPSPGARFLTFIEGSVVEVVAPREHAIFHPKIWAIRFVNEAGVHLHRGVVLSRNLTMDRAWDTALVLDEDPNGSIDAAPMASFVAELPNLALRPVEQARAADIVSLVATLRDARFAPPAPFHGGALTPIGIPEAPVWPFPATASRMFAISPFLTQGAVRALGGVAKEKTLVSRMESLELVGAAALDGWDVNVLQRLAEVEAGEDIGTATPLLNEFLGAREGLHAKTFVLDLPGKESMVITGSANLTSSPWGNNVEFDAVLTGRTADCGVARALDGSPEAPGLRRVLEMASVEAAEGIVDATIATTQAMEQFHRALAKQGITLHVTNTGEEAAQVELSIELAHAPTGHTVVWPASLAKDAHAVPLASAARWTMARANVTPFVALETTAGEGDSRATSRCVIKAHLTGDVDDRRRNALTAVLQTREDVLRYLVFLLGDPAYDALLSEYSGATDAAGWGGGVLGRSVEVALFEPLVRATGRDEDALARIASAIQEIRGATDGVDRLPEGFAELWDVVWAVHQERQR